MTLGSHCKELTLIQDLLNVLLTVLCLCNFAVSTECSRVLRKRWWVIGPWTWNKGHFLTSSYQKWKHSDQKDTSSQEILAKIVFTSTTQKHTELVGHSDLCSSMISECVALIYLDYLNCQYISSLSPCRFAPALEPEPPVKVQVSCPTDEADCRGGDFIVSGGGLFHN